MRVAECGPRKCLTLPHDVGVTAVQLVLGGESHVVAEEVTELHQHVGGKLVGRLVLQLHVVGVWRLVVEDGADSPRTRQPGLSSSSPGLRPAVLVRVGETSDNLSRIVTTQPGVT